MMGEEKFATDINDGTKTDFITRRWIHETIRINGLVCEYSRCPMCLRCVDRYGFTDLPSCPNCGQDIDK